jgi:hypothetical protein
MAVPAYTVRELPADEWEKLRGRPIAANGLPDPSLAAILVVEDSTGRIVATWSAQTAVHLEGLDKDAEVQGHVAVSRLLFEGMKGMLRHKGIPISFTYTEDLLVAAMAIRAGFRRIPGDLLLLDLTEGD